MTKNNEATAYFECSDYSCWYARSKSTVCLDPEYLVKSIVGIYDLLVPITSGTTFIMPTFDVGEVFTTKDDFRKSGFMAIPTALQEWLLHVKNKIYSISSSIADKDAKANLVAFAEKQLQVAWKNVCLKYLLDEFYPAHATELRHLLVRVHSALVPDAKFVKDSALTPDVLPGAADPIKASSVADNFIPLENIQGLRNYFRSLYSLLIGERVRPPLPGGGNVDEGRYGIFMATDWSLSSDAKQNVIRHAGISHAKHFRPPWPASVCILTAR